MFRQWNLHMLLEEFSVLFLLDFTLSQEIRLYCLCDFIAWRSFAKG